MNFNQLRIFISIAQTENFTKTAQKLYISESTVSKTVAKLEHELNTRLIIRSPHHLELTPEGKYFLEHAQNIVKELDMAIADLQNTHISKQKSITIATTNIAFEQAWLPLAIKIAKEKYQLNFKLISFTPGTASNLKKLLLNHEADILILQNDYFANENKIASTCFFKKGFSVLVNRTDPLARQEDITFSNLSNRKLLIWDSSFISPIIENLKLQLSKIQTPFSIENCADYFQLITQVRAESYTGIIPSIMFDRHNQDLSYVPLVYSQKIEYCANYLQENRDNDSIQKSLQVIKKAIAITQAKW